MPFRTVAVCETCWVNDHPEFDEGTLVGVQRPVRALDAPLEACGYCGSPTISGIYERVQLPVTRRARSMPWWFPDWQTGRDDVLDAEDDRRIVGRTVRDAGEGYDGAVRP